MIIAFSGVKFAGKDTAAEILITKQGFRRIGLADKLKDICSEVFSVSRTAMDNPSLKETLFGTPLTISTQNIESLLKGVQKDGFEFDYGKVFGDICKNFHGKNLTSIRDMLQTVGTDILRTFVKDDIWLEYIKKQITQDSNIVVTDARFKNEREYLKNIGAVLVLIKRPGYESKSTHISENQLGEESDYDVVVNNETTIYALQSSVWMWYNIKNHEFILNTRK